MIGTIVSKDSLIARITNLAGSMCDTSIANDAVAAGCAQIQNEIFWNRLPIRDQNPARMVLGHQQDPAQYCWDAYIRTRPDNAPAVPQNLRDIIHSKLSDDSIRDTTTIISALNGGTIIHIERSNHHSGGIISNFFSSLRNIWNKILS